MKIIPIAFAIALLSTASASAQADPMTPGKDKMTDAKGSTKEQPMVDHSCTMETDAAAWSSIGLNVEQIEKVQGIQADCKLECAAASKDGAAKNDAMHQASMEKHTAAIMDVLNADQKAKWTAWCKQRTVKSEVAK